MTGFVQTSSSACPAATTSTKASRSTGSTTCRRWGKRADIYLLAGDQDTTCPAWRESRQLATALGAAGYHVSFVQLTGADHYTRRVARELRDGQFQVITNDPAGEQAVKVILDAIASRQDAPLPVT